MSNSLPARAALAPTIAVAALSLFASTALADPAQGVLVSRATGVNGAPYQQATLVEVSADGTLVTFKGTDPATQVRGTFVRNTKTNVTTPFTSPSTPTPTPTMPPIVAPPASPPPGATILSSSASGATITYSRKLSDYTDAVGFATSAGAWIVSRSTVFSRGDADGNLCPWTPTSGPVLDRTTPVDLRVSADGSHLWLDTQEAKIDSQFPAMAADSFSTRLGQGGTFQSVPLSYGGSIHPQSFHLYDLGETGRHALWVTSDYNGGPYPLQVTAAADATGFAVPELPSANTSDARFFAHDTGIVRTETALGNSTQSSVYLYPPVAADPGASKEKVVTPGPGDVPDTPTLGGIPPTSLPCLPTPTDTPTPGPVLPLGTAAQYAPITIASPVVSTKSAGSVKVTLAPAGVRAASSSTITVKTFGFTVWSKKITTSGTVALPNALLWLPEGVNVTTTVPATASAAAASVVGTRTWQAWK